MDRFSNEVQAAATMIILALLIKRQPDLAKDAIAIARSMRRIADPHLIEAIVSDPQILDDVVSYIEMLEQI